jgi:ABC-type hemin transport system substrate-binding protein
LGALTATLTIGKISESKKTPMRPQLAPKRVLFLLLAAALVLLIAGAVSAGLGQLLAALGDAAAATVLGYVALACGALLVIDLVCLVLAQTLRSLGEDDDTPEEK